MGLGDTQLREQVCNSLKACGTKAAKEVNRELKTLPEILDQITKFVDAKGRESFNAGYYGLIKCKPPCFP